MNKKKPLATHWKILLVLLAAFIIWGLIGSSVASDPGITCDMGIKNALCWKWHTNVIGQVGEFLRNIG